MELKPQDIFVALRIASYGGQRQPYARIALELAMSSSEVHACVRRSRAAGLLHGPELGERANLTSLEEFLLHGVKYAFPPDRGGLTRGLPTSYAAEPLKSVVNVGIEPPPVWPDRDGTVKGLSFSPLYRSAPLAARQDAAFYQWLALVDAVRDGRARERKLAEQLLSEKLRNARL